MPNETRQNSKRQSERERESESNSGCAGLNKLSNNIDKTNYNSTINLNQTNSDKNSNSNNLNLKNKNQRDYDKEPLILRDFSKEMSVHGILNCIFFFIALLFVFAIQSHIEFGEFDELVKKVFILLLIFAGFLTISYKITIFSKERFVLLSSNMKAVYYDSNLQIRKIYSLSGNKELDRKSVV